MNQLKPKNYNPSLIKMVQYNAQQLSINVLSYGWLGWKRIPTWKNRAVFKFFTSRFGVNLLETDFGCFVLLEFTWNRVVVSLKVITLYVLRSYLTYIWQKKINHNTARVTQSWTLPYGNLNRAVHLVLERGEKKRRGHSKSTPSPTPLISLQWTKGRKICQLTLTHILQTSV